jgi:hypothetical protein
MLKYLLMPLRWLWDLNFIRMISGRWPNALTMKQRTLKWMCNHVRKELMKDIRDRANGGYSSLTWYHPDEVHKLVVEAITGELRAESFQVETESERFSTIRWA